MPESWVEIEACPADWQMSSIYGSHLELLIGYQKVNVHEEISCHRLNWEGWASQHRSLYFNSAVTAGNFPTNAGLPPSQVNREQTYTLLRSSDRYQQTVDLTPPRKQI